MNNYSVVLPSYSIGDNCLSLVEKICSASGSKAVVVGGKTAVSKIKDDLISALANSSISIVDFVWYGGECSFENVEMLKANPSVVNADMIFAVGGGKALDTCKALANEINKDVYTFPTIASNCAATTAVSIMYNPDGTFKVPNFFDAPAKHAFIYTPVIAKAPKRYIWAGMGDTYAKYFEAEMSARGEDLVHYHWLGKNVSRLCVDPILQYGLEAMHAVENGVTSDALDQVILAVVVTTGIASILLTKEHIIDYNTGLAHAVFYALTSWRHIEERHLHGEVVGYGILILLLVDNNKEMFDKIYAFNKSVGLPVCLKDIEMSQSDLDKLVPAVCAMKDIEHNPYEITQDMVKNAFIKLENITNNKEK